MQNTRIHYKGEENKKTAQQVKLLNGIIGEESISFGELKLGLEEFRPHFTNSKFNSNFKSNFNSKFVKRYEHLSYLTKAASYNSRQLNQLMMANIAIFLLVKASERLSFLSAGTTALANLFIFALIGYFLFKTVVVKLSVKMLNINRIRTTGDISVLYLCGLMLNFLIIIPVSSISNQHSLQAMQIIPLLLFVGLTLVSIKRINLKLPIISDADRYEEKRFALIRYSESLKQVSDSVLIKETVKEKASFNVISIDDFKKHQEATKFLNRRKSRQGGK